MSIAPTKLREAEGGRDVLSLLVKWHAIIHITELQMKKKEDPIFLDVSVPRKNV